MVSDALAATRNDTRTLSAWSLATRAFPARSCEHFERFVDRGQVVFQVSGKPGGAIEHGVELRIGHDFQIAGRGAGEGVGLLRVADMGDEAIDQPWRILLHAGQIPASAALSSPPTPRVRRPTLGILSKASPTCDLSRSVRGFPKRFSNAWAFSKALFRRLASSFSGVLQRPGGVLEAFLEGVRKRGQGVMQDLGCVLRKSLLPVADLGELVLNLIDHRLHAPW